MNNEYDGAYGLIGGLKSDKRNEFSLLKKYFVSDSELVEALKLAFEYECVIKVPTNYIGDRIICEEHEITNIEDFMREFGLI